MFAWRGRRKPRASSTSTSTTTATSTSTSTPAAASDVPESTPEATATVSRRSPSAAWHRSEGADIGVTSVAVGGGAQLLYEISLRFPALGWRWRVRRSYAEFAALHATLDGAYHALLQARKVRLPRAARLSWESFRASVGADAAAAHKLLAKLNAYLHKLLELDAVHSSAVFRAFLSPRADSLDVESDDDDDASRSATAADDMAPFTRPGLLPDLVRRSAKFSAESSRSPRALSAAPVDASSCAQVVHFGGAVTFAALGGLTLGLTRRGALSGSQKAAAVAAGVAGVALTGPLSAVFALGALGGGVGKYQMNKAYYVSVNKPPAVTAALLSRLREQRSPTVSSSAVSTSAVTEAPESDSTSGGASFVVENAEMFSGPRRAVKFGDLIHLFCPSVRKSVRIAQPPNSKRGHLMVSSAESSTATLRLVSPYGCAGSIACGSQVYIQVVSSSWAGEFLGVHGEFISSGKSPTVFKISAQDHVCADDPGVAGAGAAASKADAPSAPFKLRVMAYNVWLFPGILSSFNGKLSPFAMHRARAIPPCLSTLSLDVVVFCEAFCSSAREALVAGMKEQGFLYETRVVGAGASMASKKAIDGGCFAMSKYPIDDFREMTFGSVASGDDRMADKGVVYFTIRVTNATKVHVFGTHLQAWETPVAVSTRANQLKLLREFMDHQEIPPEDAVLVVGDLNVNKSSDDSSEYATMLDVLQVTEPELVPHSPEFSFDPLTNELAVDGPSSSGETERLDYVLVAHQHRTPVRATAEIVRLKATSDWGVPELGGTTGEKLVDLSDHYPIVSELEF